MSPGAAATTTAAASTPAATAAAAAAAAARPQQTWAATLQRPPPASTQGQSSPLSQEDSFIFDDLGEEHTFYGVDSDCGSTTSVPRVERSCEDLSEASGRVTAMTP